MDVFGHRRVFRGQAERVPSHRVQNIEALGTTIARDQVTHRVVPHVPDMQLAGRVWEHFKNIVFRRARVCRDLEQPLLAPDALPFCFAFAEIVSRHGSGIWPRSGRPASRFASLPRPMFSTRRRRPRALQLPRSSEDRVFEIGLDLSRNRGLGPLPVAERCCRSTVTVSELECNARDRMKTLIRYRTFGLSGGEYQSVTIEPVSGSSEAYLTKSSVSCAACHRIGLTVRPVCGPGSFSDFFLARPSTVQIVRFGVDVLGLAR